MQKVKLYPDSISQFLREPKLSFPNTSIHAANRLTFEAPPPPCPAHILRDIENCIEFADYRRRDRNFALDYFVGENIDKGRNRGYITYTFESRWENITWNRSKFYESVFYGHSKSRESWLSELPDGKNWFEEIYGSGRGLLSDASNMAYFTGRAALTLGVLDMILPSKITLDLRSKYISKCISASKSNEIFIAFELLVTEVIVNSDGTRSNRGRTWYIATRDNKKL